MIDSERKKGEKCAGDWARVGFASTHLTKIRAKSQCQKKQKHVTKLTDQKEETSQSELAGGNEPRKNGESFIELQRRERY